MRTRGLSCVAWVVVLWTISVAEAAFTPVTELEAANRLLDYGIIISHPGDDPLALNDPITRAEYAATLIRAERKEDIAALLRDSTVFPDTVGHWANGQITLLSQITWQRAYVRIGTPSGTFEPNDQITAGNVISFTSGLTGVVPFPGAPWPHNYIDQAWSRGILDSADSQFFTVNAGLGASRGMAFYLADRYFSTPLPQFGNLNYYQYNGYASVPEVSVIGGMAVMAALLSIRRRPRAAT